MRSVRDFEGYVVSASPSYCAMLGWSIKEMSSAPYWELLHPDDQHRDHDGEQGAHLRDDQHPGRARQIPAEAVVAVQRPQDKASSMEEQDRRSGCSVVAVEANRETLSGTADVAIQAFMWCPIGAPLTTILYRSLFAMKRMKRKSTNVEVPMKELAIPIVSARK